MGELQVECLCCGHVRSVVTPQWGKADAAECPRCSYLGWAPARTLDEASRRKLRERPLEMRRLHQVA